jgi:hypothetical protein
MAPVVGPEDTVASLHVFVGMINSVILQNKHKSIIQRSIYYEVISHYTMSSQHKIHLFDTITIDSSLD